MASRSFILLSAALVAGIAAGAALLLTRGAGPGAADAPGVPDSEVAAGHALGIGRADYDPASRRDDVFQRDLFPLPDALARAGSLDRPSHELAPPLPPSEPIAADPGLSAASEASLAAQPAVTAEVTALLAGQHDALRAACWPADETDAAKFTIEASFDPDGEPLSLSIPDNSDLPQVSACLRAQLTLDTLALATPPSAGVTVAVDLTLP